jgi:hypothetical protein
MRQFIRHPIDVPIEYYLEGKWGQKRERLNNISASGLSFRSAEFIGEGTEIIVSIPCIEPVLKAKGIVVRCHKRKRYYDVAIKFLDKDSQSRVRNIEQICYIEKYKNDVLKNEGRELSIEEAAAEWIEKYAKGFPA